MNLGVDDGDYLVGGIDSASQAADLRDLIGDLQLRSQFGSASSLDSIVDCFLEISAFRFPFELRHLCTLSDLNGRPVAQLGFRFPANP